MVSMREGGPSDNLTGSHNHNRTDTFPFIAIDLLYVRTWGHLYRYNLKSFVYILVWAMVHYDLRMGNRANLKGVHEAFRGWVIGMTEECGSFRDTFMNSRTSLACNQIHDAV